MCNDSCFQLVLKPDKAMSASALRRQSPNTAPPPPASHLDEPLVSAEPWGGVHELLEVQVEVLEHQEEAPVAMDDIEQPNHAQTASSTFSDRMKTFRRLRAAQPVPLLSCPGQHYAPAPSSPGCSPHDVGVVQLLEKGNLPDGCAGHSLLLLLQPDFLKGYDLVGVTIAGSVDDAIRSLDIHTRCQLLISE